MQAVRRVWCDVLLVIGVLLISWALLAHGRREPPPAPAASRGEAKR